MEDALRSQSHSVEVERQLIQCKNLHIIFKKIAASVATMPSMSFHHTHKSGTNVLFEQTSVIDYYINGCPATQR